MTFSKTIIALAAASLISSVPPAFAQHRSGNRGGGGRSSQGSRGHASGGTVYRGGSGYRGGSRGTVVVRGGRSISPRIVVSSGRFYRPYYTFRPRVSLGFGLWVGYPVSYPYYYDDPYYYGSYGYPDPYGPYYPSTRYPAYPPAYSQYPPAYPSQYPNYPSSYPTPSYPPSNYPSTQYPSSQYPSSRYPSSQYPSSQYPSSQYPSNYPPSSSSRSPQPPRASGSVGVRPGQPSTNVGGVSFDITPETAEVYVDGSLAGTVGEFTPSTRPLDLPPGHHRIEIRASGYRTLTFEENIVAGQVLPFQGEMER